MEYFKIMQETNNRNVLRPVFPTISQIWGEEKPLLVHGKVEKPEKEICFLPFYQANILSGAFLIAKKMAYQPRINTEISQLLITTFH